MNKNTINVAKANLKNARKALNDAIKATIVKGAKVTLKADFYGEGLAAALYHENGRDIGRPVKIVFTVIANNKTTVRLRGTDAFGKPTTGTVKINRINRVVG